MNPSDDPFDLQRFVTAQQDSFAQALSEIAAGAKRTHWMWFVFPQLAGLGRSAMAQRYAICSIEEARAYLRHPILGSRLVQCVQALQALSISDAERVFGAVDAQKLRSSLTLFVQAGAPPLFAEALDRWFGSADDPTLALLDRI